MQFEIKDINKSINDVMRTIGYQPTYNQDEGEFSVVRKFAGSGYPRFHLYIKETSDKRQATSGKVFVFNIHLDQKKPSYQGSHAHSGEYNGGIVEEEAERIKQLLS